MQFFVYGADAPGGFATKVRLAEEHWSFMDEYADRLIARGPTLTGTGDDAETTGSLHIVDLPDLAAAERFAFTEPYYLAGAFASVRICRFENVTGRTMWQFTGATPGHHRFLVLAEGHEDPQPSPRFIVYGHLRSPETDAHLGRAALIEAPDAEAAALLLGPAGRTRTTPWQFGGRR